MMTRCVIGLLCLVLWQESYPAPEMELQYGRGVSVEIRVEYCPGTGLGSLQVWRRFVLEYDDGKTMQEVEILPWSLRHEQRLGWDGPEL